MGDVAARRRERHNRTLPCYESRAQRAARDMVSHGQRQEFTSAAKRQKALHTSAACRAACLQ